MMDEYDELSHINREVRRLTKELDIATEKQLKKHEKKFPEIVDKIRESMKCENATQRWMISMEALRMSYKIRRGNRK